MEIVVETKTLGELYNQKYASDERTKKERLTELANRLSEIAGRERPWTWRFLNSLLNGNEGFSVSPQMEQALHILAGQNGHSAEIKLVVLKVHPDSEILDMSKLLAMGQIAVVLIIPPEEWQRHSIECAECGVTCPRWSPTQKYCHEHSWQTPEGRKYRRQKRY
jgi:hypothetical protein